LAAVLMSLLAVVSGLSLVVTTPNAANAVALSTVDLGSAANFSVLAGAAATVPGSRFGGEVGAATAITSDGTTVFESTLRSPNDSATQTALGHARTAFTILKALTPTGTLTGDDLAGQTIVPGVYHRAAAYAMTSPVTFDAQNNPNAFFIMQGDAALNTAAGTTMNLVNGAQANRIFWVVTGAATLGASSTFYGTILSGAAITTGASSTVCGRALSVDVAVTIGALNTFCLLPLLRDVQAILTVTSTSATFPDVLVLSTSGGSGTGVVTYTVVDGTASGCSITAGTSLSSTTAGTCLVTATKAGDGVFSARSSTVTIVTFANPTGTGVGSSAFTPINKLIRLVDTRNGLGAPGRVGAGRQIIVSVATGVAVPADATAAVLNVTAVNPSGPGFVTVHPCEETVPDTSTLNFVAGQTVANTTIAALSRAGQVCVWTFAETDILVDITGWLSPGGASRLTPIGPTRVVDTRSGIGGVRLGAGATMEVDFNGIVAAGSTAVALNVTAVNASAPGFLTVFPCSTAVPNTSTVNYVANEARPNNTIVGLTGGRVCIYTDWATEVLVDLVGSFGPTGLSYVPTSPIRVLDTRRSGTPGPGGVVGYSVRAAALGGRIPGAAYVNVTAANHVVPGYVTTYDCVTRRDTSTLNMRVGRASANGAIVPLSALRSCAWTFGGGDVIVDLNGWWVP